MHFPSPTLTSRTCCSDRAACSPAWAGGSRGDPLHCPSGDVFRWRGARGEQGVAVVDAPVRAADPRPGGLALHGGWRGGGRRACTPVFETFADPIVHLGGVGAGQMARRSTTCCGVEHGGRDGGLQFAGALGVDKRGLGHALDHGTGGSAAAAMMADASDGVPPDQLRPLLREGSGARDRYRRGKGDPLPRRPSSPTRDHAFVNGAQGEESERMVDDEFRGRVALVTGSPDRALAVRPRPAVHGWCAHRGHRDIPDA